MPQSLQAHGLPPAGGQRMSYSPAPSADSAEAKASDFTQALDNALKTEVDSAEQASASSDLPDPGTAESPIRSVANAEIIGEDLPYSGKILPMNTEPHPVGNTNILKNSADPVLRDTESLDRRIPSAEDPQVVLTDQAIRLPITSQIANPFMVERAAKDIRLPADTLRVPVLSAVSEPAMDGESNKQSASIFRLPANQPETGLQIRSQAELATSVPGRTAPDFTPGLESPIQREAATLAEKSGYTPGIDAAPLVTDGDKTAPNQTSTLPAVSGTAKLFTSLEGLSQDMKSSGTSQMSAVVGSEEWKQEFKVHMRWMVNSGSQQANLKLNPAELGSIEIKISTEGDQARLLFVVQHASAREAIEGSMPKLKETLEQSGMFVASSEVEDQSLSRRGQDDGGHRRDELGNDFLEGIGNEPQLDTVIEQQVKLTGANTLVDYYI